MRRPRARRPLVILAGLAGLAATAAAATAATAAAEEDPPAEFRAATEPCHRAEALRRAGDLAAARAAYEDAYRLARWPRLRLRVAEIVDGQGDARQARDEYERYLDEETEEGWDRARALQRFDLLTSQIAAEDRRRAAERAEEERRAEEAAAEAAEEERQKEETARREAETERAERVALAAARRAAAIEHRMELDHDRAVERAAAAERERARREAEAWWRRLEALAKRRIWREVWRPIHRSWEAGELRRRAAPGIGPSPASSMRSVELATPEPPVFGPRRPGSAPARVPSRGGPGRAPTVPWRPRAYAPPPPAARDLPSPLLSPYQPNDRPR